MEKRNRWLTKIERKICNFSYTATSVICSQHFEKECYTISGTGKFMLKSYAVPTIFNMPLKAKYNVHDTVCKLLYFCTICKYCFNNCVN